jgi:hypothetical protein
MQSVSHFMPTRREPHSTPTVWAEISFDSSPSNFTQFNTTSSGQTYTNLVDFNQVPEAHACWNANVSTLAVPEARNGTNATILVLYEGGDGTLYQVSDLLALLATSEHAISDPSARMLSWSKTLQFLQVLLTPPARPSNIATLQTPRKLPLEVRHRREVLCLLHYRAIGFWAQPRWPFSFLHSYKLTRRLVNWLEYMYLYSRCSQCIWWLPGHYLRKVWVDVWKRIEGCLNIF